MDKRLIVRRIEESVSVKEMLLNDREAVENIEKCAMMMKETLRQGGKILFCGNGGSASDALHAAAELTGRFLRERGPLAAVALNGDPATLTAIANDYGYEHVFERQVQGLMRAGDLLIGISTSGNSRNVELALLKAKELGAGTAALLGRDGGAIRRCVDCAVLVRSDSTARIQECHITVIHILCELLEACFPE